MRNPRKLKVIVGAFHPQIGLRLIGRPVEHAMADDRRRQGQGRNGVTGVEIVRQEEPMAREWLNLIWGNALGAYYERWRAAANFKGPIPRGWMWWDLPRTTR